MRTLTELEKAWGLIQDIFMSGEHIVKSTMSFPMVDLGYMYAHALQDPKWLDFLTCMTF